MQQSFSACSCSCVSERVSFNCDVDTNALSKPEYICKLTVLLATGGVTETRGYLCIHVFLEIILSLVLVPLVATLRNITDTVCRVKQLLANAWGDSSTRRHSDYHPTKGRCQCYQFERPVAAQYGLISSRNKPCSINGSAPLSVAAGGNAAHLHLRRKYLC